ncbi:DUF1120 domain-containing protein, partial [Salmonella enterica subsp. enterica serovar Anatum]|nr:DUF1120 domain-containing protein [Salmonella enterica subsp. enterica serovar Anatum]
IAASFATTSVNADTTAVLKVTGQLVVGGCTPELSGGGVVDYGITASSQSLSMMILGTALTGLFSVVAQILVPLAATLATPATRG